MRILGLSEGNDRTAMSGVAGYVFDALEANGATVQRLDYSPVGLRRLFLGATSFRRPRSAWVARFHTSRAAHDAVSRRLAGPIHSQAEPFDVALQVHGWALGQPTPYTLYLDQTRLMADRGWPSWMPFAPRERNELLRREATMYEQAGHLFTMGEPTRESLIADYGVDPTKVSVVGGGLNLAQLPAPRPPSPSRNVLFIGRDFERKGGEDLLEAFAVVRSKVHDATLHVVGVERRFDQPGVVGHGRLADRAAVTALYESARVFCLPTRYEPWGLVFAEAMAHSVPCVGATVQSVPEILDNGEAGRLVPPGDPMALADTLVELLEDDDLAAELGRRGRRWVEAGQTWDHVARRMQDGLRSAAANRLPRS